MQWLHGENSETSESNEDLSGSIREEVQAQVSAAVVEIREELEDLRAQISELWWLQGLQREEPERGLAPGDQPSPRRSISRRVRTRTPKLGGRRETTQRPDDEELTLPLARATEEEAKDEREAVRLPRTLFTYCMARLAVDPGSIVEPVAYLILQQGTQLILATCAMSGAYHRTLETHIEEALQSCIHVPTSNVPSVVCLFLAAMAMRDDDREHLASVYPGATSTPGVRAVAMIAWCVQSFVLPVSLLSALSSLVVASNTALEVIIDGMAVLFILEVDNALLACVPPSRRSVLESEFLAQCSPRGWVRLDSNRVDGIAWRLFALKFLYVVYLTGANLYWTSNSIMIGCLAFYFVLTTISIFSWRAPSDARAVAKAIFLAAVTAVFGIIVPTYSLLYLLAEPCYNKFSKLQALALGRPAVP